MHVRVWDLPKRSASMGIWAGNVTLPLKSTSSNYVRHLGWPEKLSIIYVFTSLESRADIFSTPPTNPHPPPTLRHLPIPASFALRLCGFAMIFFILFFLKEMMQRSGCYRLTEPFAEAINYGTFRIYVILFFFCPSAII